MLPRQERERLASVLAFAVAQDSFEEVNDALVLCLPFRAQLTRRGV
jgi:hypothetical protein